MRRSGRRLHLYEVGVRWPPETFVGWKLEGLAARGMRVTVASKRVQDPHARLSGVELVAIPRRPRGIAAGRIIARHGLALLISAPRRVVKLVRGIRRHAPAGVRKRYGGMIGLLAMCLPLARFRPDLVKFEWNTTATDYLPLFDVWGCPVVTSCRGSDTSVYPHIPGLERYAVRLPEVMKKASAVHCISASVRREALRFGLAPAKARVIRPGVDPELFRPAAGNTARGVAPDGVLGVVMVGWLRWEKGYEYALEALRGLVDRGAPTHLEIIGAVPSEQWRGTLGERERILHTAADLGLQRYVHLRGQASSVDISRRLQASDVLLHSSVSEGIPAAIVEAMACELPVVATNCGGVSEAVTDGVEGFLVTPREPEHLAEALFRLWQDPALRRRMGAAGRARVLSEFTLEHEHAAFVEMYREVIGG
ncbi:MAG: glycosyltransferase family 4 protein [Solirubrobacterales bacterium]